MDTVGKRKDGGAESSTGIYTPACVKQTTRGRCHVAQGPQPCSVMACRDGAGWGRGEAQEAGDTRAPVTQTVNSQPAMQETWFPSLGPEDPREKGMATHSSILACRSPWVEEPDGVQSTGLQRIRPSWATKHALLTHGVIWRKLPQDCKARLLPFFKKVNTKVIFISLEPSSLPLR